MLKHDLVKSLVQSPSNESKANHPEDVNYLLLQTILQNILTRENTVTNLPLENLHVALWSMKSLPY